VAFSIRSQEVIQVALANDGAANEVNHVLQSAAWITRGSGPPTTGSWTQGQLMLNTAPVAGGIPGWMCVASGVPGTWKALAALAP
jgi:hypothetical protein